MSEKDIERLGNRHIETKVCLRCGRKFVSNGNEPTCNACKGKTLPPTKPSLSYIFWHSEFHKAYRSCVYFVISGLIGTLLFLFNPLVGVLGFIASYCLLYGKYEPKRQTIMHRTIMTKPITKKDEEDKWQEENTDEEEEEDYPIIAGL